LFKLSGEVYSVGSKILTNSKYLLISAETSVIRFFHYRCTTTEDVPFSWMLVSQLHVPQYVRFKIAYNAQGYAHLRFAGASLPQSEKV